MRDHSSLIWHHHDVIVHDNILQDCRYGYARLTFEMALEIAGTNVV